MNKNLYSNLKTSIFYEEVCCVDVQFANYYTC